MLEEEFRRDSFSYAYTRPSFVFVQSQLHVSHEFFAPIVKKNEDHILHDTHRLFLTL